MYTPFDPTRPHRGGSPLCVLAADKIRFAESFSGPLPPWDDMRFGERGHGPRALGWDSRFRSLDEFEPRWQAILSATTRSWVNLDVASVRNRLLLFVVEYKTDDHVVRTWSNEVISINGGVGGHDIDALFRDGHW